MRVTAGNGNVRATENDLFFGPIQAFGANGLGGVIYCHGAGQLAYYCRDSGFAGQYTLTNALGSQYAVASCDNGGASTWANATAVTAVGQVRTWLQSTKHAKSGKVALVGDSMGSAVALAYAFANPGNVACVAVAIPICDLNDVVVNNRGGFAASVNTAYGGAYNDATDGPTHSPVQFASQITVPVRGWYASDDNVAAASAALQFAAACPTATFTSVGALGHSEAAIAAAPPGDILSFIGTYL